MINPPTIKELINIIQRLDEDIIKFDGIAKRMEIDNTKLSLEAWVLIHYLVLDFPQDKLNNLYDLLLDIDTE